jgi:hypothetical protein
MRVRLKSFSALGMVVGILFLSASCQNKVNTANTDGTFNPSGTNNPTPIPTGTIIGGDPYNHSACPTGSPPGYSDAGQTIEYYKLNSPTLSAHGSAGQNRHAASHPDGVVWSSLLDMSGSISQNALITNSRFNIRVRALTGIGGNELDSKGIPCIYIANDYTKLQLGITLKKQGTTSGDYFLFDNVGVNQFSAVHPYTVPFNTNDPLVIEVKDVKWDYTCIDYTNQGFPNVPGACPYAKVWDSSCVAFEIQFSTDDTKDIPCPKQY